MALPKFALRAAGRVRRRVYPQADVMRADIKRLKARERKLTASLAEAEASLQESTQAQARFARQHHDMLEGDRDLIRLVRPYTMTSWDKLTSLVLVVRYLAQAGIEGAFVECGVWKGGSVHLMARVLQGEGQVDRDIYLFDTFSGMTAPTDRDIDAQGNAAADRMARSSKDAKIWAIAPRQGVEEGLRTLDYPFERFHFVEGPVEETIPDQAPERIALLRLDTDWYESTKHELEHLWDRLVVGGVLVIDDYGSFQGAREATDDFFATCSPMPLLQRAGNARVAVKR